MSLSLVRKIKYPYLICRKVIKVLAYKAFEKDLTCRGYQFELDKVNITDKANCRENGFHAAEDPLDCLSYYPDWKNSDYYLVNVDGDIHEDGDDSKISCTKLTIIKKLDLKDFVLASLIYISRHPLRVCNSHIKKEQAEIDEGFLIVRGKYPKAKGKLGTIIGLAIENPQNQEIMAINIFEIDGKDFLPDQWYDVKGNKVCFEEEVFQ